MITFFVNGQTLRLSATNVVADTFSYLTARFLFQTADWGGTIKVVHLSNGDTTADVALTDDAIRQEDGLNLTAGRWSVYLTGHVIEDGVMVQRITTNTVTLTVIPSGVVDGEPLPSLPSIGEQLLADVSAIREETAGIRDEAQSAADSAALDAAAARYSAQSIMFPVFWVNDDGEVVISYAERLGSTSFALDDMGYLHVEVG